MAELTIASSNKNDFYKWSFNDDRMEDLLQLIAEFFHPYQNGGNEMLG